MRTASICPTCATFENALCVLYNGVYLTNAKISPLDSLETALVKINANLVPLSGAAAPAVNATYLGQQYLNTTTKQFYYARSVGSGAADWTLAVNGTVGQIGFYSSQYNVIGDNAFFWDNTNKRLGVGTVTPLTRQHTVGGSLTTSIANVYNTATSRFDLANPAISLGIGYVNTDIPMIQSFNNGTNIQTNLTINPFGGNVAIGKTTATKILDVAGDILVNDILIGKGAGQLNSNTLVGQTSLVNNTTGYQNTVLGFTSMQANTVGYQNTAVGAYSLTANVGGHENVAVGDYALTANTSGYDNVTVGARASLSSTTGYRNVAIGKEAMFLSVGASQSVAIGYQALVNGATDSVAIGFKSGHDGGTNVVAIGFESLTVNTGTNNTGVGYRSLYSNITGTLNTGLGYQALRANITGVRNTAVGGQALYTNTDGNYNIAVGYDAGRYVTVDGGAANTSSASSIYIGYKTLSATAADTNAIVIGNNALSLGSNTVVIGNDSITTTLLKGSVGIGTVPVTTKLDILADSNINRHIKLTEATNNYSFALSTTNDDGDFVITDTEATNATRFHIQKYSGIVTIGSAPLTSALLNVRGDGYFTKNGGGNITINSEAFGNSKLTLTSNSSSSQKAYINSSLATGSLVLQTNTVDRITIGSTGNTWIGGTSSFTGNTAKLEVTGYIASSTLTDTTYERYVFADTTGKLIYSDTYAIGVERVLIGGGGNPNAISTLEVNLAGGGESNLSLVGNYTGYPLLEGYQGPGALVFYVADTGDFNAASYNIYSDRTLKENIVSATSKLDDILKVNVVNYNLINDKNKLQQVGVIAQEVEEIFPTLISEDKNGIKGVNVSSLIPILIKGMQEQQDIIKNLQTQIDELKSKI